MLKITAIDAEERTTLVLEGRLVDPWISELEQSWTNARRRTRTIVVDLKDVTAISDRGEDLLFRIMTEGALFNCCRGVLTRHLLQLLERRRDANSRKAGDQ